MSSTIAPSASLRPQRRIAGAVALIAALMAVLVVAGCTTKDEDFILDAPRPSAEIFNEGLAHIESERHRDAVTSFEELDRFYPFSDDARRGMVLTAFAAYQSSDFDLTIDTAQRFLLLYPTHEDADYALYLLGEAYLRTVPDITRDQAAARNALAADEELVERYPNSRYADLARVNIIAIRDQLAGQEMLIGRYYQERREYGASINRFRVVVTDYQDTRHIEEALFRLTETYLAMGLVSEAQATAAILGHNFPDSEWYQDAYRLMGAGGVEPDEDRGFWLSRLFRGGN